MGYATMISRAEGLVLEIKEQRDGLTEIIVDVAGNKCPAINYDVLTGTVGVGDRVLLNTTAVDLKLGTGGNHFVMANLSSPTEKVEPDTDGSEGGPEGGTEAKESSKGESQPVTSGPWTPEGTSEPGTTGSWTVESAGAAPGAAELGVADLGAVEPGESQPQKGHGHIMKLRYTPNQLRVLAVEEEDSPFHELMTESFSLSGIPVVCCGLHSMLPPAAAGVKALSPELKVVYVMTDGAALPLSLSRLVHNLKNKGLIDGTITVGHAFGGDLEAVNIYSGFLAASAVLKADVIIAALGPGIVGTGTPFGFTGIEQTHLIHAAHALEGFPIAVPRLGFADSRERHQGLSHHSRTTLGKVLLVPVHISLPVMQPDRMKIILEQMKETGITAKHHLVLEEGAPGMEFLEEQQIRVTTMGRSPAQEPEYFLAASCAGRIAAKVRQREELRLWEENLSGFE